jgi:hypothetical protein
MSRIVLLDDGTYKEVPAIYEWSQHLLWRLKYIVFGHITNPKRVEEEWDRIEQRLNEEGNGSD